MFKWLKSLFKKKYAKNLMKPVYIPYINKEVFIPAEVASPEDFQKIANQFQVIAKNWSKVEAELKEVNPKDKHPYSFTEEGLYYVRIERQVKPKEFSVDLDDQTQKDLQTMREAIEGKGEFADE